jgi:hypothetical protein
VNKHPQTTSPASSQPASSATSKKKSKVKPSSVASATVASSNAAPASKPDTEVVKTPARHAIIMPTPKEQRDFEAEELEMREEARRKEIKQAEKRRAAAQTTTPTSPRKTPLSPSLAALKKRKVNSHNETTELAHSAKKAKTSDSEEPSPSGADNPSKELTFLPPSITEASIQEYSARFLLTDEEAEELTYPRFDEKLKILAGFANDMGMYVDTPFIRSNTVHQNGIVFLPAFVLMDVLNVITSQLWDYGAALRKSQASAYDQGYADAQDFFEPDVKEAQARVTSLETELAAINEVHNASLASITRQLVAAQANQTTLQVTIDSLQQQLASGPTPLPTSTSTEISVKEKEAAVKWVNQVQLKGDYALSNTSTPPEYSQAMDYVWREQISLTDPSKQAGMLIIILRQWLPEGFINRLEVAARRKDKPLEQCTAEEIKQLYVDTLCLRDDIVAYFDKGIQLPLKKNTTMRQYLGILQRLFSVYPEASHRFVEAYNWMVTTYVNHDTSARWSSLFSEIKTSLPRSSSKADQALLDTLFEKLQVLLDRLKTEAEKNSDLQHPDMVIPLSKSSSTSNNSDRDYTAGAVDSAPAPCAICNMTNHVTAQHTDKKRKRETPYAGKAQSMTTPRTPKFPTNMYDRNASCGLCGVRGHRDDQCQASTDRKERFQRYLLSKAQRAGASVEVPTPPPALVPPSQAQSLSNSRTSVPPTKYIVLINDKEFEFKDKADYERSRRLAAAMPRSSAAPAPPTPPTTHSRPTTPNRE